MYPPRETRRGPLNHHGADSVAPPRRLEATAQFPTGAGEGFSLRRLARLRFVSLLGVMQFTLLPLLSTGLRAQPNQIIPDGRTATNLQTSGNVTNVTTSTVSGPNAFNSFSQFGVGQGNTVNLQLPSGTQNLINVVRDAPAYVNGTLNSYANGTIGGNVYFADPQGFVVGPSGTVNVGSLNVSTPTREFTDKLIGAQGQINGSAVNGLLNGSFPISPDGNVRILGRINAADGVRLTGQNVYVGGGVSQRDLVNQDHAAKFAASVNSKGLRSASGIVVSNGSIHIVAAGNARLSGRLAAHSRGTTPSTITVDAGKNVVLGKNARLSTASKSGDAGDIVLKAADNLTLESGARIDASSAIGNAGLVDLSANGKFAIGDHVRINLAAPKGNAGTLLMDPTDIVIGAAGDSGVTLDNTSIANAIAALSTGATYVLQADNSISLNADAVIDTRRLDGSGHSTANAFNVELDAPTITMAQGAQILAMAVNSGGSTWTDGSVTLNATASQSLLSGQASATTGITVDGTITGGAITIAASSTATSSFTSSLASDFALVGESLAPTFLGLNGGYVAASSTANVAINGHASITGSGAVTISATASEDAEDPVIASALAGFAPFGASVVVGNISGTVSNTVASGATISAGGSLNVNATNTATLNVAAVAATSSAVAVATVAYSQVNVDTTASIQSGARLSAGTAGGADKGLSLIAVNNNSFTTTATAIALSSLNSTGGIGGALAISNVNTAATATLGASLGASPSNRMAGDVVVEATSYGVKNATQASVIVGTPGLVGAIQSAMPLSIMTQQMTTLFPADLGLKAAAALSLATSSENATAAIAQNPSGGAPSIYASGNVSVISDVVDEGVRSNATSSAIATDPLTGESVAIAVAVAWGTFSHNSDAYIGDGVLINASNVGVAATSYLPITNAWLQWDGLSQVLSHLNGTLGIGSNIMTSYASATADAGDTVGLAGAVGRFTVDNNTTAWVATDATLVSTSTDTGGWTVPLHGNLSGSSNSPQAFTDDLQVLASTTTQSIDAAGNVGTFGWISSSSGGSSFGGAINLIQTNSNTIAGVSAGASLSSATSVAVDATTIDLFFGASPTSGKAAGALGLNGITSIALVDNTTHASISDQAFVSAPSVSIDAAEDLSALSVAGSVVLGGSSGVGLAVAYLGANTDTSGYIGDNHADITAGAFSANDPFAGDSGGSGSINTDNLSVNATTSGRMTAVSVAAAISEPSVSNFASKASAVGGAATGGAAGAGLAASKLSAGSGASTDGFSIDVAGSSSVTDVALGTSAYIQGATVNRFTATSTTATTSVQALNDTILDNGSGSASVNLAGSSGSGSVAVGGAISVGISSNATLAYISDSTINNQQSVTVQALNGGQQTVVGIAIAASNANSASISGSAGFITDSATAYIADSTLSGVSGSSRAIEVDAYQTSDIAIGGGSLYLSGGNAGVGIAMTYASITDPTGGNAVDAHVSGTSISNYDTIAVLADNASVIAAGAASGGVSAGNGGAGAIIVDQITPTTTAYIGSNSTVTISVTGAISVTADSVDESALDTSLGNLVKPTSNGQLATDNCTTSSGSQNCVDFTAAALNGGTGNAPGASIISVAGIIQAGKNNVGAALVFDTIATTHSAYIADVLLTSSSGDVAVAASDSSQIQSVAIGFGLSTGQFAGVGGTTISSITNTVSAAVGDSRSTTTQSTISAAGLSVTATDRSEITGTAAVGGASTQGSAAGLSIVYSNIANTVSAGVTGSLVAVTGDVGVSANSTGTISTVAVGVAISSQVGLAGSVATNLMGTNVTADITGGADVTANNNVAVLAGNSDNAAVFAGAFAISKGAAGGAGSLVTNKISGSTSAYISGSTTEVDALGTSSSDTLSVNGGTLANAVNLGSFSAPTDNTPDLTENQDTVTGLAVVASSHQAVVTNVASLAASSGVSIMVNPIVNVMAGATNAYIDSASIDTRLTSTAPAPQIDVAASSFSYSGAFGLGIVAPTGTAGGGATIVSTTMERTTQAYIVNATIGDLISSSAAVGAVTVKANAEQDASSVAVGFNSGSVGLNVFNATTEAYVDGGSVTAASLRVNAKDSTGIASANGSGSYGSAVAIGAAFLVQVSANQTEAYVGDEFAYEGNGATNSTAIRLSGALDVEANTTDNFQAYSVGGAVSTGTAAVAGMANIEIANNTTVAGLYDTTVQSPTGAAAGAVTVNATENVTIMEIAGALAVGVSGGGVGVGAAANVIVFKSETTAETRNSDIDSSGVIDVNAESTKEVLSYAVTAGVGGSVGIGAAVGVVIIGTNDADSDTQGQITGQLNNNNNGTIAAANAGTNSPQGSGAVASGSAGDPSTANASSTYDVSSVLTGGNDGVTAQIAGGNVTGSEVDVGATSAAAAKLFLLGAGFGKNAGVGAGIGYTIVDSSVLANLSASVTAPTVSVSAAVSDPTTGAYAGKTVDSTAIAGGLALYFGADAAVAIGNVGNTVTAELGGSVTGSGGAGVLVTASDTSTQSSTAGGGSGGIAAIGASVATTSKSSSVTAKILPDATVSSSTVLVSASEGGALSASATAVAGGVVAGDGAAATAKENSTILAEIGAGAAITTSATDVGTLVSASATPDISTNALGVAVGGIGVGVSVAMSDVTLSVTADIGNSATFTGGDLAVTAAATVPTGGNTTYARSIAGGGGSLLGLQGSYSEASEDATVKAFGGTGLTLPAADVTIAAENDSNQYATATGIAVGGYIGLGATVAQVSSNAVTQAYLDAGAITSASNTGVLQISATGTDTNTSSATAGSGGTFAGAAAVATTSTTASTSATLFGSATTDTLYLGGLSIQAMHTTNYSADGDAFQASIVGASGGSATNTIGSTTAAEVGTNMIVNSAGGDMDVIANDVVNQTSGGSRAGSGGAAAGAATLSSTNVTQTVTANVDSGTIFSLNDDPSTSTAKINIEAYNTLQTVDTVSLTAGGLFAGGGAESDMTATATLTVNVNAAELFSAGDIDIGTASTMEAANNANANLYGVITGAGASTNTFVSATQDVNVGGSSKIEGWGLINIYAGQAGDGSTFSTVSADATTVVYNYALVPISAEYKGTATAQDYTNLTLAGGSQVLGVNNVFLGATQGAVSANGSGTNYNPYLTAFSTENHDDHSHPDGSGNVALNGVVVAGIYNQETLTIPLGATAPTLSSTSPYTLSLELVSDPSLFNPVVSYNHQAIQYAVVGGFNPYQTIVAQLVTLSGLTTAQVQAALSSASPSITIPTANDPTGDIQRQINTLIQQAPFAANASGSAFAFGNILVSAGNVSILAQSLTGAAVAGAAAPFVSARDSVSIDIENQGLDFIDLSNLTVTGVSGGHLNFTGSATASTASGIAFQSDLSGATPVITVNASYSRKDPNTGQGVDQNGAPLTQTPDIYFDGTVTNLNGLLNIANALGNVVASQTFNAATIEMQVPNGSFTFNGGVGSIFNSNHDVASQWAGVEYRPTDTLTAVEAAATYLGTYGYGGSGGAVVDGNWSAHPYFSYWDCCDNGGQIVNNAVTNYSNASQVFTARLLNLYYGGGSLYSAIFLPTGYSNNNDGLGNGGIPANNVTALAQAEGASTSQISVSGWQRHDFQGQAYSSNDSGPFNCSGCGNYFQVVNIQSQAVNAVTANTASNAPANQPFAIGKAIILSASVLNINGTIQSGQSSNYSVNIGSNAENAINSLLNGTSSVETLAQAQTNALHGNYFDLTPYLSTVNGSDVQVGARFNVLTDQVLLNSVVQGTGGYVYLNGKIISTSTDGTSQGNIVVNGGAGTITVNNTTGYQLVTNTINTGVSAASVVEIVDQLKQQTTWYVYNAAAPGGQQVSTYQANGVNASGYQSATLLGTSGPSGVTYSPEANQYYQWVDTATLTRPVTNDPSAYGWTFSGVSANSATYPYTETTSLVSNVQQVVNGSPNGQLQSSNYQEVVTATGSFHTNSIATGGACCGTDFKNGTWNQEIYDSLTLTLTNTVKASYGIGIQFNGGGSSSVDVTSNAGIVVNGPINNLQGVTSLTATGANSAITTGASVNNPLVSGTSVTLIADGGIGVLGAASKTPLPVQVYGGTLTAISIDNDIAIAATGSLSINQVKVNPAIAGNAPQGSVYLSATGDINSASAYNVGTPIIVGKSIEIDSSGGAVGAMSGTSGGVTVLNDINPLVIQATGTTLIDGTIDGGIVNSSSSTGTYLVQSTGNLRLGSISSSGPVFLEAAAADGNAANIINGLTSGGLTAAQSSHLQAVWSSLNLVSGSGAVAVSDYQSLVNAAYTDYWQLRNLAFNDGQTYSLTATGTTVLTAQVAAEQGIDPSAVTAAQLKAEATTRFEKDEYLLGIKTAGQLGDSLATLFGSNLASNQYLQAAPSTAALTAALTSYNAGFSYVLPSSSALYAEINSGSQWTQDQLTYTVSAAANPANGVPPPSIAGLPLNVSGRQVMLYAPSGSIGSLASPQTFSFTSVDASSLTAAQKGLLASAGPGQLTVTSSTDPVSGIVSYTASVSQQSLVIVSPLGPVSAKAQSQIYLGSASDLLLGGIADAAFGPVTAAQSAGVQTISGGNVKLDAVGNILEGVAGQVAISGNILDLTLIAETGSIGQAPAQATSPAANQNALQLALSGSPIGQLDQAVAGQGIYVNQTTGDLVVGNVTAAGPIQLAASGSIYAEAQFTDRSFVHIAGSALDLRAGGNVSFDGSTFQPLQVQITGAVTGNSVGTMTILSPASDLTVGAAGAYGSLSAGGALTLSTIGALTIDADVTGQDALQLLANGAVTFAAGTSLAPIVASSATSSVTLASASLSMGAYSSIDATGVISVTTTGNATLGQLETSLSYAAAGNAPSIVVVAAGPVTTGAILSNGDGRTNLVASGAGAEVSLGATSIGTASQRVGLDAALLTATATNGGLYLDAFADLEATLLSAVKGSVDVLGSNDLTLDSVLAGTAAGASGTFNANAAAGSISIGSADSGGTQTIHASQNVTFNQITTSGAGIDPGNVSVTADNGFVLAQTVPVNGVATQGSVAAHGSASLTAGTTITGNTLTAATGAASLMAHGAIDWTTLTAATTLGASATAGSITFATADSGGTQTIHASQNVTFNQITTSGAGLDAGNVSVTADNGFVLAQTVPVNGVATQGSVAAHGSASLTAGTTITGNTLTAATGAASLTANGPIDWTTLTAATTFGATSATDAITLATASSGGTQTLHARQNVTFDQLTTSGIPGDVGNVNVTSDRAAISGGSIEANGSANLVAATDNTGIDLMTITGSASLQAGGLIDWANLNVGRTLAITSTGGEITLDTATSGGTQTLLAANDIVFTNLTTTGIPGDAGDVNLTSEFGSLRGGSIFANGDPHLASNNSISLDQLRGNKITLSAPNDLTLDFVSVVKELDIAANTINVTGRQIPSVPAIPLVMNVTGYNGGAAKTANIDIDPLVLVFDQFRVVDAFVVTDAPSISIVNGYVPGQLMLTTPTEFVLLDNRSPAPSAWPTLQLYQPGGVFTLSQNLNASFTDSYVVFYSGDIASTVSTYSSDHVCCSDFTGSSMVRDIPNQTQGTETIDTWLAQKGGVETFYLLGIAGGSRIDATQIPKAVETIGPGPAVNIEGLAEAEKFRRLERQSRKAGRGGWRSGALLGNTRTKSGTGRFADAR